jgi:hypothetical protein
MEYYVHMRTIPTTWCCQNFKLRVSDADASDETVTVYCLALFLSGLPAVSSLTFYTTRQDVIDLFEQSELPDQEILTTMIGYEDVMNVISSWDLLKAQPNYRETAGELIFIRYAIDC